MKTSWLQLAEHETRDVIAPSTGWGEELWTRYARTGDGLDVEFPSPRTAGTWRITSRGVVGAFPLRDGGGVRVVPKVPIHNLLRMIEIAEDVPTRELEQHVPVASIEDLFDRLVASLTSRVHRRLRVGLHKSYVQREDRLPYLRGRLDIEQQVRRSLHTAFDVQFQETSVDHHDNRVLLATLRTVARSPLLRSDTRASVRRALRALASDVSLISISPGDAVRPPYHRLRTDYLPMHRLCRFLLARSGPTLEAGSYAATPFLLDMPRLFETFVAKGMSNGFPAGLRLARHVRHRLDPTGRVVFDADLVLYDVVTGRPRMVLDTKYKDHDASVASDVQQVIAYAAALGCHEAALVYPTERAFPQMRAGEITVRRFGVPLDGDPVEACMSLAARVLEVGQAETEPSNSLRAAWVATSPATGM